jgi:hypothetical protein
MTKINIVCLLKSTTELVMHNRALPTSHTITVTGPRGQLRSAQAHAGRRAVARIHADECMTRHGTAGEAWRPCPVDLTSLLAQVDFCTRTTHCTAQDLSRAFGPLCTSPYTELS